MRHGKKFNHLGRKKGHRRALLMNLSNALIEHKRINTTLAKAKALRVYVEPLITKGKDNSTHSRRVVFSHLQSKESIVELFGNIATKIGDRPGGYTRVIKTGFRKGDGAEMAMIELVDFNEVYSKAKSGKAKTSTRRRKKKSSAATKAASVAAAAGVTAADASGTSTDDLTKIEGIGPKIASLLNAAGITTFSAIATAEVSAIKAILEDAGSRYTMHDPTTWAEQGQMAANGEWDALKKWQDLSDGGKPIDAKSEEE